MIQMKPKNMSPSGFTLIEMIVVIIIIAILAAIGVPQYQKTIERGRYTEVLSALNHLHQFEQEYMTRYGLYTTNIDWPTMMTNLDATYETPKNYTIVAQFATAVGGGDPIYSVRLMRNSGVYSGVYSVQVNETGQLSLLGTGVDFLK